MFSGRRYILFTQAFGAHVSPQKVRWQIAPIAGIEYAAALTQPL